MRADRLLSMIWLLRTHGCLPASDLARRLEVSRRTVLRDVEALSAAGVPVWCERGPHGGVRIDPSFRVDVTGLNHEESRALFAGLTDWGALTLGLGDAFASAARKLLAAVPDSHRSQSVDVASRVVVDPQGWLPLPESERADAVFHSVQEAVFTRHRLRMVFRHKSRTTTQDVVDPHGMVAAGRSWYLCASHDGDVRFTRLSRIEEAEILTEECSDDSGFDITAAWQKQREEFLGRFKAITAAVWVRDERWSDVQEWTLRTTTASADSQPPGEEGWSLLQLEFMDHLHAMTILLRLGPDARVITPEYLRQDVIDYLKRTFERYQQGLMS
nr:YafY family protein [Actinomyces viscosus]